MSDRVIDTLARHLGEARDSRRVVPRLATGAALACQARDTGEAGAGGRCFVRGKRCRYDRHCCSRGCRFGSCR